MLSHADLSNVYQAEAVATATYLHNRMVSVVLESGQTLCRGLVKAKLEALESFWLHVQYMHMFHMDNRRS